jgi:hypothetical protein
MPRKSLLGAVAAALLVASPIAGAANNPRYDDAAFGTMALDGVVVRPLGIGATVLGAATWIVTLPFSALGGNAGEAAQQLIVKPARFTFTRPLGEF